MNTEQITNTPQEITPPSEFFDGNDEQEIQREHTFDGNVSTLIYRFLRYAKSNEYYDRMIILNYSDALIRLALKYKNSNPITQESLDFYLRIVRECRNIYHRARIGLKMTKESISFLNYLQNLEEFKDTKITYYKDQLTLTGIIESRMSDSVEAISEITDNKTLLLIPIGNGGIFSALELSTHIQDKIKDNSLILPIKFSRRKDKDAIPIISEVEIKLIKYYIEELDAVPVIWDDDVVSSNTLVDFMRYISHITQHDEFRIMGGNVRGYHLSNNDNALNKAMIANSTIDLERDTLPK